MARPSKTNKQFAIYEDAGIPTPDSNEASDQPSFDDALRAREETVDDDDVFVEDRQDGDARVLDDIVETVEDADIEPTDDDERRESAVTSISSLPESSTDDDQERSLPMHKPYTPPMIRPSFRRPQSVQRMQMTSPIPFERSPRRSALHSQSRSGTPRSTRSSVKGSPRSRRSQYEEHVEVEKKEYPLVLLHVSLLPVELRWSMEAMQEVLPQKTLDNLQLLRSKVTETILQRGILIPHPREEYELLEERLLEALELREERVTKCGHFRARDSISSTETSDGGTNSDSGVGSSVESDEDLCGTCRHHFKSARTVVGSGGSKWNIRVFAANGLMRASAWVAAWSEMERVDVEILPWIGEDLRRQLNAKMEEEEDDKTLDVELPERIHEYTPPALEAPALPLPPALPVQEQPEPKDHKDELPQIYRAKDVPLSLLLKNYISLLAKDRRNIAIFGLAALALWLSLRAALIQPTVEISALPPVCETTRPKTLVRDPVESAQKIELQDAMDATASQLAFVSVEKDVPSNDLPDTVPVEPVKGTIVEELEGNSMGMSSVDTCDNPSSVAHLFGDLGNYTCSAPRA